MMQVNIKTITHNLQQRAEKEGRIKAQSCHVFFLYSQISAVSSIGSSLDIDRELCLFRVFCFFGRNKESLPSVFYIYSGHSTGSERFCLLCFTSSFLDKGLCPYTFMFYFSFGLSDWASMFYIFF
jgi:hypothetical protein